VGSKTRCWRWEDERDSDYIYEGALAFLQAEYRLLAFFVVGASIVLAGLSYFVPTTHINSSCLCFRCLFLGSWEYGNENSNKTNVRTTQAARTSLPQEKFLLVEEP
jgi:K(+)-stimulated pyrophosphate-energized sodium pump